MFLTAPELAELTGYQRHADQRKWLTARGWLFEVAATGRPIVARSYAESRLGGQAAAPATAPAWRPNVAAIRKAA
jgi:hypothetical protein